MKKNYTFIIISIFMCIQLSAQSYFAEGYDGKFERWIEIKDQDGNVTGERPYGWHAPYNSYWDTAGDPGHIQLESVSGRSQAAGKACKIIATGIKESTATWHFSFKNMHWSTQADYNPFFIDQGDDFFYTFWAKADKEGMKIWIGAEDIYNPSSGSAWANMPSFELTTEWKQYGYVAYATLDLVQFNIHPRMNGVLYVDDIEVEYGSELPELNVEKPNFIFEIASNQNPISLISSTNGIAFNSLAGCISIYDAMGKEIIANREVKQGNNFISLETKGLHIVKFRQGNVENAIKAIVR